MVGRVQVGPRVPLPWSSAQGFVGQGLGQGQPGPCNCCAAAVESADGIVPWESGLRH